MNLTCFVTTDGNCPIQQLKQPDFFELHITTVPLQPQQVQEFT